MTDVMNRMLPAGIQSFKKIREEGYLYVDKSDVVWRLANSGKQYNYLSRPRRFGKSILVDTLESYLLGKKELFEVFAILKADDEYECFVFITGITKFTQISLFSVLNNLTNISFLPEYATICGITEQEIGDNFKPELEKMAEVNDWTLPETHDRLKDYYDGYHFSRRNMVDIYNPYSLINALDTQVLGNFWASSGATSLLQKFVSNIELRLGNFEGCRIMKNTLELSDGTGGEVFLYQYGYLTIKDYDEFGYTLGFPNEETKQALYGMVQ